MTSVNDVRIIGVLKNAPEFKKTASNKPFAVLSVETEKFLKVNGESRRITQLHRVECYNQFSISFLENYARVGKRVKVFGELDYDRNGQARIIVNQYGGEVAAMDIDDSSAEAPAANPASKATPMKAGGGLGRLSSLKSDAKADPATESDVIGQVSDEDCQIPF